MPDALPAATLPIYPGLGQDVVAPTQIVVSLPLVILHSTLKSKRSFLLVAAHPGCPGKRAVKRFRCGGGGAMETHGIKCR